MDTRVYIESEHTAQFSPLALLRVRVAGISLSSNKVEFTHEGITTSTYLSVQWLDDTGPHLAASVSRFLYYSHWLCSAAYVTPRNRAITLEPSFLTPHLHPENMQWKWDVNSTKEFQAQCLNDIWSQQRTFEVLWTSFSLPWTIK